VTPAVQSIVGDWKWKEGTIARDERMACGGRARHAAADAAHLIISLT